MGSSPILSVIQAIIIDTMPNNIWLKTLDVNKALLDTDTQQKFKKKARLDFPELHKTLISHSNTLLTCRLIQKSGLV